MNAMFTAFKYMNLSVVNILFVLVVPFFIRRNTNTTFQNSEGLTSIDVYCCEGAYPSARGDTTDHKHRL